MNTSRKNYWKLSLIFVLALLFRLLPFRAPNVEPILATVMPASRVFGGLVGFFFGALSILFYDLLTGTLGVQTFFTAGAFGLLGWWSDIFFKRNKSEKWGYLRFAIIGTLFFDAFTGLTVGPLVFHQPFLGALIGQIPFTLLHLTGNIIFALLLSPVVYTFLEKEKKKKLGARVGFLKSRAI